VNADRRRGTVYSTEAGRTCPKCGWPAGSCRCSTAVEQPVPDRIVARLRIEKAGRRGKTVTVVESLPRNTAFLKELAGELKRACATGGKVIEDRVEIQGDHREKLRELLKAKGWTVKG
jgi:translation initiation factor 1